MANDGEMLRTRFGQFHDEKSDQTKGRQTEEEHMRTATGWFVPGIGRYGSLRKLVRQLVPTKFATGVRRGGGKPSSVSDGRRPVHITWWMWLGRSFAVCETDLSVDAYVVEGVR